MATPRQVRFIKSLAKKHDLPFGCEHLGQSLDAILYGKDEYVPSYTASAIIDALMSAPLKSEAPPASFEAVKPKPKPQGFWKRQDVKDVLQLVLDGSTRLDEAAASLGVDAHRVKQYAALYRRKENIYDPEWKGRGETKGEVLVSLKKADLDKVSINWATFLDLERPEGFDLQVVCAMFYASEQIMKKAKTASKITSEMASMIGRAQGYISIWAERFGKYTLAACLGEFRHRRIAGKLKLVPKAHSHKYRAACQHAAAMLWPDREKTLKAAEWLTEKFADPTFFTSGHTYGGRKWSVIAKTFLTWYKKEIPDVVFADYVWDLSHNGGMFFNKCSLFQHETSARILLNEKKASTSDDVRVWAKAGAAKTHSTSFKDMIHPDWLRALDMMDVAQLPAPEERR